MRQNVGILLPVASLPSEFGIGDFGPNAYRFIDWLSKHHFRYWQVLPLNPLGYGNSPYMSTCSIALDYRYISLEMLEKQGLISDVPHYRENSPYVNYEKVDTFKDKWIYKAYLNYRKGKMEALKKFKTRHPWVMQYATYETFKKHNNYVPWNQWSDEEIHYYENHNNPPKRYLKEIDYIVFKQYLAHNQWHRLL
ncbi:MAG: 4-alpha-glucanotransferase, partial [Bacilli bacterium]|nr:4-alpha-glucanotransferase [Bacilli bacterium]